MGRVQGESVPHGANRAPAAPGRVASAARRALILCAAAALAGAGLLYAHWVRIEHRLTVITPDRVFQSAAMPPEDLLRVAERLGIQTVFDFRADPDAAPAIAAERDALLAHGIRYVHLPSSTRPARPTVAAFVRDMQREVDARHRVLMHCHDGEGRAVFFAAIYRIEFEGWDNERAYAGTARLPPALKFVSSMFPFVGRLSATNPKTPLIRTYQRMVGTELARAAGGAASS